MKRIVIESMRRDYETYSKFLRRSIPVGSEERAQFDRNVRKKYLDGDMFYSLVLVGYSKDRYYVRDLYRNKVLSFEEEELRRISEIVNILGVYNGKPELNWVNKELAKAELLDAVGSFDTMLYNYGLSRERVNFLSDVNSAKRKIEKRKIVLLKDVYYGVCYVPELVNLAGRNEEAFCNAKVHSENCIATFALYSGSNITSINGRGIKDASFMFYRAELGNCLLDLKTSEFRDLVDASYMFSEFRGFINLSNGNSFENLEIANGMFKDFRGLFNNTVSHDGFTMPKWDLRKLKQCNDMWHGFRRFAKVTLDSKYPIRNVKSARGMFKHSVANELYLDNWFLSEDCNVRDIFKDFACRNINVTEETYNTLEKNKDVIGTPMEYIHIIKKKGEK